MRTNRPRTCLPDRQAAGSTADAFKRAMHIGFFTSIEGWGGSETYLKSLATGVQQRGHRPTLFGIRGSRLMRDLASEGVECVPWSDRGQEAGRAIADCGSRSSDFRFQAPVGVRSWVRPAVLRCLPSWAKLLAGSLRETRRLTRLFDRHRVDVMHVGIHGYELAGLACRRCGIPCLGMHMTTPVDEGYWARRWLMRYTDRRYGHVCSQSRFCTGEWKRRHGLRPDRTSFIWSSVDTDRFRPAAPRRMRGAADEFRLVSVGRLHAMKGFEFLIEAVAMLNDGRVTAEILGEGDERGNLEQRIRDRRLAGTVRLRGYVEDPRPHLAEADCFVLPSVSLESCPAVLPEAMAMGLPLITSDFGPLTEVNVDGQTGWVVPVRDSVALAGSIREAMERPDRCRSLGEAGQRRAGTSFSRDRMLRETLALYGRLARRTSGSPT